MRSPRKSIGKKVALYAVMIAMFAIMIGPFLWQLATSFKGPQADLYSQPPEFWPTDFTFDNYAAVSKIVPVWQYAANSLIVAIMSVAGNVIGATLAGYALAMFKFRGRGIAFAVFLSGILVPAEVILISRYLLMLDLGLNNTLLAVILPGAVGALNVLLMRNAFQAIPKALDEAAMIDGANAWQRFLRIALPSVRGTTAVVAIFAFVGAWNDFLWPLIVLSDQAKYTLTVGLNYLQGAFTGDPRVIAAGTIIAIVPLVALFFCLQRFFFRGVGEGGIKG